MQKERHEESNFVPSMREYIARYQVGVEHVRAGQKVLHPGPINRGVEISAELADSQENLILSQVEAGLAVRMAVLYRIIVDSSTLEVDGEIDEATRKAMKQAAKKLGIELEEANAMLLQENRKKRNRSAKEIQNIRAVK
jgi:hypothetical protein